MSQVISAAAFMYFLLAGIAKGLGYLTTKTVKVRSHDVPAIVVVLFASLPSTMLWMLFSEIGLQASAIFVLVAIEAYAFYSIERGAEAESSSALWLAKAFALGGIFFFSVLALAPSASS